MTCICRAVLSPESSGRPNGYCAESMTYSMTPQLHTSALLPSYVFPRVAEITSGARYAGVPTLDPGAD